MSQHGPEQRLAAMLEFITAEKAVIDAAYKALAKRCHPDMNQDKPGEAKLPECRRLMRLIEVC